MVEIVTLANGMPVILEQMEYLRSASFGVWIRVGSVNETRKNNGISHMIEHMLFKGTKNRNSRQLAEEITKIGGNLNAYTSKECTSFYVTALDQQLLKAVSILGDMLSASLFLEEDIEKEKGVILEEINMYEDSPEDMVHEMLQKEVWRDHPLGFIISGEKPTVMGFSREELVGYKERFYTADRMVLSLAGHFDKKEVLESLEKNFGCFSQRKETILIEKPVYHRSFYQKQQDMEQIHMNLAFPSIDYNNEDKYTLSILNSILGGGDNSRLFQIIREELGYVYSIYSYESLFQNAGLFHIDTVLNPVNREAVFEKIMEILDTLKKQGVSQNELYCAKEQVKTELIIGSESTRTRMCNNGRSYLCRGKISSIDEVIQKMNEVDKEKIHIFLNQYFNQDDFSMSMIGNMEKDKGFSPF